MSNGINAPYGLIAVESVSGDGATRKMKDYKIAVASDGTTTVPPIYYGDPVKFGEAVNPPVGLNIIPALTFAVGSNTGATMNPGAFLGTFIACRYTLQGRVINSRNWPGNTVDIGTSVTFFINDDPNTIFKVQMSTSDAGGANANLNGNSSTIFQNWMVGQNAVLQLGGNKIASNTVIDPQLDPAIVLPVPTPNPTSGNNVSKTSGVYLDGLSISILAGGTVLLAPNAAYFPAIYKDYPTLISSGSNLNNIKASGNPAFDVKIIGLAPSSNVSMGLATALSPYNELTPGVNMPFCDVLVKFNNHVYGSAGVAGPSL